MFAVALTCPPREDGAGDMLKPPRLLPIPREGEIPLSFAQQRLWFLDRLEPGASAYTIAGRRRRRGSLDPTALASAFTELTRRHEALRTTFTSKNGQPVQCIAEPTSVALRVVDLERGLAADRERVAEGIIREEAQRPFDLARGPLFRPVLLRFGPDEHELLILLHHIVADGWSFNVLTHEVDVLYEAYVAGRPSPLPELPLQYADFALWQRQWLTGDVLEGLRRYWHEHLSGRPAPLTVPADYHRPRQPTFAGASYDLELPRSLVDSLQRLGRSEGATLFMTLLAGFKVLLSRYTGQVDIVVGTPVANRTRGELESLVGFFANTLVLRTDLAGDPTFRQSLGRVREVSLGAYAHQDLPFEKLVEELQPERALGQNPLFEICFVFQAGTTGSGFDFVTVASPFDLTVFVRGTVESGLRVIIEYKRDLFAPETIARLACHYRTLLAHVAATPDCRLSAVPLLSGNELRQLLVEWNATATDYPRHRSIHSLFEDHAAATPEAVAVVFEGTSLTYRELDRRANQLAHYLRALGIGRERAVGVWMERSAEMLVALLGILKAGGAYAPLDLMAPSERLAFTLNDAEIDILLTQERMVERLPAHEARTICLDDVHWSLIGAQPDTRPPDSVTADNLAYIMYTSGSTGEPKGVAVTHRNVVRLVKGTDYARFDADEVFLQLAPLSFDASTFEIWGALLNGGRLAVAPPGAFSVDELGTMLERYGVTTLWLTAGLFHEVVDHRVGILRHVRQLLAGGDVLSASHVRHVLADLPGCRLVNGYGPTEGTTFSCCYAITSDAALEPSVPIGRPIANTRGYVLDRHLQPVPIGVPGELWIAGDGVARGYVNRPTLMSERFVLHRFSETLEERLYGTGDVVRWLANGTLEFLGRRDEQVKVRGYRVELGEIEVTLARHPRVREAALMARRPAEGGSRYLVAYVVADGPVDSPDLREFLSDKLPEYMIPAAFVTLDRLPLTPNGKIDKRALPEPAPTVELPSASAAPRDQVERQLVRIWEEVLSVNRVATRDNFFDLGGHSLLAVRMFARLEECLGIRLPLATLFQAPTIEGLAAVIRASGGSVSWRSLVAIRPTGSRSPVFAVPGVGGNVLCYNDLARLMAPDQPFYGLQSRGLDGAEKALTRIEDIAAVFLREIREVQPRGPYNLLGACMGGVVAYEMAQQLCAAGQEVGPLILLETWLPGATSSRWLRPPVRARAAFHLIGSRLRVYVQTLAKLPGRKRLEYLRDRLKMLTQVAQQRDVFRGDWSEWFARDVTEANLAALRQYEPRVYPGRAVLVRAEGRSVDARDDRRLSWRQLITGGLEIYTMPGDDSGLMLTEPHVQVLARQLKACIERAQPSAGTAQRT
jgi:amino acid adenylation domain-containing protein